MRVGSTLIIACTCACSCVCVRECACVLTDYYISLLCVVCEFSALILRDDATTAATLICCVL